MPYFLKFYSGQYFLIHRDDLSGQSQAHFSLLHSIDLFV